MSSSERSLRLSGSLKVWTVHQVSPYSEICTVKHLWDSRRGNHPSSQRDRYVGVVNFKLPAPRGITTTPILIDQPADTNRADREDQMDAFIVERRSAISRSQLRPSE